MKKKETKLVTENIVQSSCEVENDIFFLSKPRNKIIFWGRNGKSNYPPFSRLKTPFTICGVSYSLFNPHLANKSFTIRSGVRKEETMF